MTEVEVIAKLEQVFRDIFDEEELTINNETINKNKIFFI